MVERRTKRTSKVTDAIQHFLEVVCRTQGLTAAALTTHDGLLIAGAGQVDVQWIGALGASSSRRKLEWDSHTLHVAKFDVNDVPMCLTTAGAAVRDDGVFKSISRILAV